MANDCIELREVRTTPQSRLFNETLNIGQAISDPCCNHSGYANGLLFGNDPLMEIVFPTVLS
jgi:hypothetical protein